MFVLVCQRFNQPLLVYVAGVIELGAHRSRSLCRKRVGQQDEN